MLCFVFCAPTDDQKTVSYKFSGSFEPAEMYITIFFELIHLSESRPLIPHYLGELMAFQVKQTFHPTLDSMWVTAGHGMLSIMAVGATCL